MAAFTQQTITFLSLDSIMITADIYHRGDSLPVIVLCHQAGFSRGEYKETARQLNELGFNCIAIDQRSGREARGVMNETFKRAMEKKLPVTYLDAEQDMIAAVDFAYQKYNRKVILLGSSYSASLALKVAKETKKVEAVIAFSPGEYFGDKLDLKNAIKGLDKPAFITSSKSESADAGKLIADMPGTVIHFIPQAEGVHGSRALWKNNSNHEEYWVALKEFLKNMQVKQ